jgi:hypothetical protein
VTDQEAQQLFNLIHKEGIFVFYACIPASFGVIDVNGKDPPAVLLSESPRLLEG